MSDRARASGLSAREPAAKYACRPWEPDPVVRAIQAGYVAGVRDGLRVGYQEGLRDAAEIFGRAQQERTP